MRVLKNTLTGSVLACMALAGGAVADDLPDAKTAQKMLFKTNKRSTIVNILAPELVPAPYKDALEKAVAVQHYYEAMAASPDEGMLAASAFLASNHHNAAAAHAAAIAGCNAKKAKSAKTCVVVAEFLPKGYDGPRAFSLSFAATAEFTKTYRRAGKPKAFAISPTAGSWGFAVKADTSDAAMEAALADCAAKAAAVGAKDCVVVSAE